MFHCEKGTGNFPLRTSRCELQMGGANCSRLPLICSCLLVLCAVGCTHEMVDQPRYEPLEASTFFPDGLSARPLVEGTVARGHLRIDTHLYTGRIDGELADTFPFALTRERLERGRERFDIFCAVCHDRVGTGRGMVVRRGFPQPPSYHIDRLRDVPVGHFYDVMTNGLGRMPSYATQIPPEDRWAIAAYVRALQFSQHWRLDELPEDLPDLPPEMSNRLQQPGAPVEARE